MREELKRPEPAFPRQPVGNAERAAASAAFVVSVY